jgi:hypothetical protein
MEEAAAYLLHKVFELVLVWQVSAGQHAHNVGGKVDHIWLVRTGVIGTICFNKQTCCILAAAAPFPCSKPFASLPAAWRRCALVAGGTARGAERCDLPTLIQLKKASIFEMSRSSVACVCLRWLG